MERRLIDANELEADYRTQFDSVYKRIRDRVNPTDFFIERKAAYDKELARLEMEAFCEYLQSRPTIDAVEVVRCRECIYFRDEHVLTPDGKRKSYSEFPPEAFGGCFKIKSVTSGYGINVGSQCLVDCNKGYGEDKSVFRQPDDYCSRGVRREPDENTP